jgi:hypothetical protein
METRCRQQGQDKMINVLYDPCARHGGVLVNEGINPFTLKFGNGWN